MLWVASLKFGPREFETLLSKNRSNFASECLHDLKVTTQSVQKCRATISSLSLDSFPKLSWASTALILVVSLTPAQGDPTSELHEHAPRSPRITRTATSHAMLGTKLRH